MLIKELFRRLSRFIPQEALSRLFLAPTGEAYRALQSEILSDRQRAPIDAIGDFIFGINADSAQQRISQTTGGIYVFVDYGEIGSSVDPRVDVKTDTLRVAITVARSMPTDQDQFAEMMSQDECLQVISRIRSELRDDQDLVTGIWWMRHPSVIRPFTAKSLANSLGWSMEFDVQGVDVV